MQSDTLYISDLDGTLLDDTSRVSDTSASIISDLSLHGAMITVATARTPATVEPLLHNTHTTCPAIVMTGAALWERSTLQLVDTHLFASSVASDIVTAFARHDLNPFTYVVTDDSHLEVYHSSTFNSSEQEFYNARRHLKKFHLGVQPTHSALGHTILIFGIDAASKVNALAAELSQRHDCSVSCYPDIVTPSQALIEVFAPQVSKANAVKALASTLGAKRIVVFGDNLNDLSMMSVADLSVAVDNALPQVKEAADMVIGPNSSDSVAHFIAQD